MENLSAALTIISAMITPAVLILATGSMLLTTSQRLGRTLARLREVYQDLEAIADKESVNYKEKIAILKDQVPRLAKRSWLLQKAMTALYLTLTIFIATSVLIGIIQITGIHIPWVATVLTLAGTTSLFYSSLLLISESRLALEYVNREMSMIKNLVNGFKYP